MRGAFFISATQRKLPASFYTYLSATTQFYEKHTSQRLEHLIEPARLALGSVSFVLPAPDLAGARPCVSRRRLGPQSFRRRRTHAGGPQRTPPGRPLPVSTP